MFSRNYFYFDIKFIKLCTQLLDFQRKLSVVHSRFLTRKRYNFSRQIRSTVVLILACSQLSGTANVTKFWIKALYLLWLTVLAQPWLISSYIFSDIWERLSSICFLFSKNTSNLGRHVRFSEKRCVTPRDPGKEPIIDAHLFYLPYLETPVN